MVTILGSGLVIAPGISANSSRMRESSLPGNNPGILSIGVRLRDLAVAPGACKYGKMVACCNVDGSKEKEIVVVNGEVVIKISDEPKYLS